MRRTPAVLLVLVSLVAALALPAGAEPQPVVPKVVGGTAAETGAWPEVVALVLPNLDPVRGQFCAGTLIDPLWVLTAAHCLDPIPGLLAAPTQVRVLVGSVSLRSGQLIGVSAAAVHPGWDGAFANDIALLRLASPAPGPVLPYLFPGTEPDPWPDGSPAQIVGWGRTTRTDTPGGYPDRLFEAPTLIRSDEVCQGLWGAQYSIGTQLCARSVGVDACLGDSGGPLVARSLQGRTAVAGVVSFGTDPCAGPFPGVYTRVAAYADWVRAQLGPRLPGDPALQPGARSVERLYRAVFLRVADQEGFDAWLAALVGGTPLSAIASAFASSAEFQGRYGALDDAGFVGLLYLNVLDRVAEAEGQAYWTGLLAAGVLSRGDVVLAFSESPEFRAVTGIP